MHDFNAFYAVYVTVDTKVFLAAILHIFALLTLESALRLLSSADNLCRQFGPDQDRQNVGPDLDPNRLTL